MKRVLFGAMVAGMMVVTPVFAAPKKTLPAAAPVLSPVEQAAALRDAALKSNVAYDFVSQLTTRFGPRPAGSPSEQAAAQWAADELKAMGFDKVHIDTFPLELWERGEEQLEITGPFPQKLVVTALGGSGATPADGIEAEAALFETYDAFLTTKDDLTGKIVVILQPTVKTQTGTGYGVNSGPIRSQGPEIARKKGAVGYVMRALGTHDHRFAHTGATRFLGEAGLPSLAISPPDAEQFERIVKLQKAGQAGPIRLKMVSTPQFLGTGQSQNVIGEITGRTRPQEIITIGGHLDSWDLGTGAIDDGAGMAITMAAAKAMIDKGVRPARTVRVIFWGSEEVSQPNDTGLAGATAYAKTYAADDHVAAAESDFGADVIYALSLPETNSADFRRQVGQVLSPLGIFVQAAVSTGGGPDTSPLFRAGVPVFNLHQNGMDYFDYHHTADDVLERIDPAKLTQNVAAWAATVWLMADSDVRFKGKVPAP